MEVKDAAWVPVMRDLAGYTRELEEQLDGEDCGEGPALIAANSMLTDPLGCGFECHPDFINPYCPAHGEGGSLTNPPLDDAA